MKNYISKIKAVTLIAMMVFLPINLSSAWHSYSDMEDTDKIGESYPDSWRTPHISPEDTAEDEKRKGSEYEDASQKSSESIIRRVMDRIVIAVVKFISGIKEWVNNMRLSFFFNMLSNIVESGEISERMEIIEDEDASHEDRVEGMKSLTLMLLSREVCMDRGEEGEFQLGIDEREEVANAVIDNISLLSDTGDKELVLERLWVFAGSDPDICEKTRERIQSVIEEDFVNERNERIWNEFSVFVMENQRELSEADEEVFYSVLSSLPEDMLPPLIIFEEDTAIPSLGGYDVFSRKVMMRTNNPKVLFHEIGHFVDYNGLSREENRQWEELWGSSRRIEDYGKPDGIANRTEDFAVLYDSYVTDTLGFTLQTIENTRESGRDVRLRKIEFMAELFSHESSSGSKDLTYVYEIQGISGEFPPVEVQEDISVVRKTVALTEQEIDGETYMLPDFNDVYEEEVF